MPSQLNMFRIVSQLFGGVAVLASLVFVGYELKRNNDLAVVQSQQELIAISVELKAILTDPATLSVLTNEDVDSFNKEEALLFEALVGAWFDLYELAILSEEKGVLTDEQFVIWMNGMCSLPTHWLQSFDTRINRRNNFLTAVGANVQRCLKNELLPL